MKALLIAIALPLGLAFAAVGHAQVPAGAPAGTTGMCKDGSYTSADAKRGACRGHKGVKDWYAAAAAAPAASADAAAPAKTSKKETASTTAAAAPSAAPAGSTGQCKDGSYTDTATKRGACRGHKGVQEWYGATAAAATPAAKAAPAAPPAAAPAGTMAASPKMTQAPAATPASPAMKANPATTAAPAPGGGAGKVWVNTESKVYHCADDRYYGKTKQGEYMSEADALAKGNHASHGKSCAK
jgi:hypothetical protein